MKPLFIKILLFLTFQFTYLHLSALDASFGSSSSTNNLCSGSTITFTASYSSPYYRWRKETSPGNFTDISGANSSVYVASNSGTYRLKVGANSTFTPPTYTNIPVTINNATALSITNNLPPPGTLFPSVTVYQASINTTFPPDYTSIDWYFNGALMQTSSLTSSIPIYKPGNYMAVAQGCGAERSNSLEIKYDATNSNWDVTTYLSPSPCNTSCSISGNSFVVGDEILVQSGGSLVITGATLNFNGCFGIRVESGGKLEIGDRSILSSTTQWNGILIEDGGELIIKEGSYISDAVSAVILQGEAKADIQNCNFGRNVLHVGIDNYYGNKSTFIANDTFGQVLDSAVNLVCGSYSAYNNLGSLRGEYMHFNSGNHAGNHPVKIYENIVWKSEDISNRWNSGFIFANDVDSLEIVENQVWGFFNFGIKVQGGINVSCFGNDFKNLKNNQNDFGYSGIPSPRRVGHGMYFKDVTFARILENNVSFWEFGSEYYENLSSKISYYRGNMLRDCNFGLIIANIQNPINYTGSNNSTQYSNQIDLNIYCNLFKYNNYGIVGTGDLLDQGSNTLSAGNRFYDVSLGGLLNTINSIIWHTSTSNINYYCSVLNGDDGPQQINNGNIIIDNTSKNGANSNVNPSTNSGNVNTNICTSILTFNKADIKTKNQDSKPIIFPNPNNGSFQLQNVDFIKFITITNIEGKELINILPKDNNLNINLMEIHSGMYFVRFFSENSNYTIKLIINQ